MKVLTPFEQHLIQKAVKFVATLDYTPEKKVILKSLTGNFIELKLSGTIVHCYKRTI